MPCTELGSDLGRRLYAVSTSQRLAQTPAGLVGYESGLNLEPLGMVLVDGLRRFQVKGEREGRMR